MKYVKFNKALLMRLLVLNICFLGLFLSVLPVIANGISFLDDMNYYNTGRWTKADNWTNGSPFAVGWRSDHITYSNGVATFTLDETSCPDGCSAQSYASGELRTTGSNSDAYYGYGCFEARLKAATGSGLVTGFFTYSKGPYDQPPGGNGLHNEIDIEILGKDTTQMQVNFFTNNDIGHEYIVDLNTVKPGFNAATDYHIYGFKWTAEGIEWYVDNKLVHSVPNTVADPTPVVTLANGGPQKIMTNLWAVDSSAASWAGAFTYTDPISATVDWIRYTAGSDCNIRKPIIQLTPVLSLLLKQNSSPVSVMIEDFENISDWVNQQNHLEHFDQSTDVVQGAYSMHIGGTEENATWVGAAYTSNWDSRPIDWTNQESLQIWIKRGETLRGGVPQLSFILSDTSGGKTYLHKNEDTCLNWNGGGWRTSINNDSWQLYVLPLRHDTPDDCYYSTTIDWAQVNKLAIEVRTSSGTDPDDVYLDSIVLVK